MRVLAPVLQQQRRRTASSPSSDLYWSFEVIAAVTQCPLLYVRAHWPMVVQSLQKRGLVEREVMAGALGTIAIETASSFCPVMEAYYLFGTPTNYDRVSCDAYLRTHDPSRTYYPYYGRGFVQTTWESNYRAGQEELGLPLVTNPGMALQADIAAELFALYFRDHGLRDACLQRNWRRVRYLVLGGYDGADRLATIAETLLAI